MTERLDSKARQAFALAAGAFAVSQAAAFVGFDESAVTSAERLLLLGTGLLTAASLMLVAIRLHRSEQMREEANVSPAAIYKWCREATEPGLALAHLIWAFSEVSQHRIASNAVRRGRVEKVYAAAGFTVGLAAISLVIATTTRI